ncbi:pectin lyase-like protein [Mollisia scopiformis]|uniref:Pectin lyase-like protein n=1 Tax=Mollisia scopiformis TaxID=149040 RepID=A0A132B6L5_MOLSC|nr:pectin lyase-like protein [Mollisia scopiformis]KUJ07893.1 pectin lyase-like protein [Mollisia scopiformis]
MALLKGRFLHVSLLVLLSGTIEAAVRNSSTNTLLHRGPYQSKRVANVSSSSDTTFNTSSFQGVSQSQLANAYVIVDNAVTEWSVYKKVRFENPKHNIYTLKGATAPESNADVPVITEEVAAAAALVAEVEVAQNGGNTTKPMRKGQSGSFWMEDIERFGSQPYGGNSSYPVFRNVLHYGAHGDGTTDDTKAINAAIQDGNRCGPKCYGSSTKNAIVYFPGGNRTYLVSSPIIALYGTQMIGDPNDRTIIKATKRYLGLGVISTDVYTGAGGQGVDGLDPEYYINTANFYRQIRNFVIDITDATFDREGTAGIHYQVSQATSMFNVRFICSSNGNTKQRAIFAENGSGGFISDLTFEGGAYGIQGGNQQFTAHRLTFTNVRTAIWVFWDWGWTWKSIHITGTTTGFNLTSENGIVNQAGSILVQDSIFENVQNAIVIFPPTDQPGQNNTGVTLDNVVFKGVTNAIIDNKGKQWLAGSIGSVDIFLIGPVYNELQRTFSFGTQISSTRSPGLLGSQNGLPKPAFLEHARSQYEKVPASQFVSVKKNGAKGDASSDDTLSIQEVIDRCAETSSIVYIDAGSYLITDTLRVQPGTKIVGELWAQLVASIGESGQKGSVEIQDLLFTTVGETKGLIAVEWNLEADEPGSTAMWDCHVRIGGATGSQLTSQQCPPVKSGVNSGCTAGSLMFRITSSASAYLENVWLWVADHDLDDADLNNANNTMTQVSVYVARGILIESRKPTWLYGTASEHSAFYQYSFYKAKEIYAGMIQTESPYYQPNPRPPAPFNSLTKIFPGDPSFEWAVRIERSANISFSGAGLYSWFNTFDESCVDGRTCQNSMVEMKENGKNIQFLNLITIRAKNMVTTEQGEIAGKDNEDSGGHPKWTHIAALRMSGDGGPDDNIVYIDPIVWTQPNPHLNCTPPCIFVVPPHSLPTRTTIQFPRFVTSLEVDWLGSKSGGGSELSSTIVTTTLTFSDVILNSIDYSNIHITGSGTISDIVPRMSIDPGTLVITDNYPVGITATPVLRTITTPPFPWFGISPTGQASVVSYMYDGAIILVTSTTTITFVRTDGHTVLFGPTGIVIDGNPIASPTTTTTTSNITIGPLLPWFSIFPSRTVSFVTTDVPGPTTAQINGTPVPVIPCLILFGFELPGIYFGYVARSKTMMRECAAYRATDADCGRWGVVYPKDHTNEDMNNRIDAAIKAMITTGTVYRSQPKVKPKDGTPMGTMYWAVERISDDQIQSLKNMVELLYSEDVPNGNASWVMGPNVTIQVQEIQRRADIFQHDATPEMITISMPPEANMGQMEGRYIYDDSAGKDQTIYAVEIGFVPSDELSNLQLRLLYAEPWLSATKTASDWKDGHGACVAAKIGGKTVGIARAAKEVVLTVLNAPNDFLQDSYVDALIKIYDDIIGDSENEIPNKSKTSVVNISLSRELSTDKEVKWSQAMINKMGVIIRQLVAEGVPVVVGAGNRIVVGASMPRDGNENAYFSLGRPALDGGFGPGSDITVYAPGAELRCPNGMGGMFLGGPNEEDGTRNGKWGTSYASPTVAGLVAYFKALQGDQNDATKFLSPRAVKERVRDFAWRRNENADWPLFPPVIWNGQAGLFCGTSLSRGLTSMDLPMSADANFSAHAVQKRQSSGSQCTIDPSKTNPANNPNKGGPTWTYQSGPEGPTCTSGGCGKLCPTGSVFCGDLGDNPFNPDFWDPLDPRSPQNPANPDYVPLTTSKTTQTPTSKSTMTTTTASPTPTGPAYVLEVNLDTFLSELNNINLWAFFDAMSNQTLHICDSKPVLQANAPSSLAQGTRVYPNGTFNVKTHGMNCVWTGDGKGIGIRDLVCPGKDVTCREAGTVSIQCPTITDFTDAYTERAYCSWY